MLDPATNDDRKLWHTWRDSARQDVITHAIGALYADLDQAVRDYGPTCWASGKCCKFESYGHRLYVTGLEIAWFLGQVAGDTAQEVDTPQRGAVSSVALPVLADRLGSGTVLLPDACRYQRDGLCSVHTLRPLGCRIFFCQEGTDDWQHATYEAFQQRLTALHEAHAIPYRYMEWRAGLVEADRYLPH